MPSVITSGSWNATQSNLTNSIGPEGFLITVAMMVAMLLAIAISFYSVEYLAKVVAALSKLFASVKYVAYGLATSGLLYGLYLAIDAIRSIGSGLISPVVIGYGLVGYIVFYVIGRVSEYLILRAKRTYDGYAATRVPKPPATMELNSVISEFGNP